MKIIYTWILRCRQPQTENDYIDFLIRKIRDDAYVYRAFKDLLQREDGKHPAIISKWRPVKSGQLVYLGKNSKPMKEELRERKAIEWLVSKGIAEPEGDNPEDEHWYFLSQFGWKVKLKYEGIHS